MAKLDATTLAEYGAAGTVAEKVQAVIDALANAQSPQAVTVRIRSGASPDIMATGMMANPWATQVGGQLIVGELTTALDVLKSGTPDANWTIEFSSGTRWLTGTFGLAASGKEFTWSLASFDAAQTATLGAVEFTSVSNHAPQWSVDVPTSITLGAGGTYDFSAYAADEDGDTLTFSLVPPFDSGYVITSAGVLTAGAATDVITIRVSDGSLFVDTVCTVTVQNVNNLIKWNPGHYVWPAGSSASRDGSTQRNYDFALLDSLASNPYVKGVSLHKFWYYFESTQGNYDSGLNLIQAYLDKLGTYSPKKRLMFTISDRAWATTGDILPPYILANGWGNTAPDGTLPGNLTAWARIWITGCRDAYVNMWRRIAQEFDGHPLLEIVGYQESANGAVAVDGVPYADYVSALQYIIGEMHGMFDRTLVRYNGNYAPNQAYEKSIMQYVHGLATSGRGGIIVGGPDPEGPYPSLSRDVWTNRMFRGLDVSGNTYQDLRNQVAWVGEQQYIGLGVSFTETPARIWDYQYNTMRASHQSWVENNWYGDSSVRWNTAILPLINSIQGATRSAVPSTLTGRTVTGGT